jgi:hypothetical protein
MGRKLSVFLLMTFLLFSMVSAIETDIGTKKVDSCIDLIQTCADCTYVNFTSYTRPNGTRNVIEKVGVKDAVSFTYNDCNITDELGTWIIDGHGDVGGIDTVFSYTYEVTTTGNPTPEGMPMFQMGVLIIIFGVSCFLLYLSFEMKEPFFKMFFLVISLIFLMATVLTAYMVSADGNVSVATNTTTLSLVYVLGSILFIIFLYIMIRQTVEVLDMFRIKRGLKMTPGYNVGSGQQALGMKKGF